ncbi:MAG: hypothetical protein N2045_09550 [Fimbriimonadales bacterium]|nr:hypothetical protein [Fimbriimonadales bacterium]
MPRLLLVFPNLANVVSHELVRVLRRWGYETALAGYVNTTTLKTHDGTEIDPNSNTARNYLRQFDAVCVFDTARFDEMGSTPSDACSLWLQWNDDADPPVLFFGMHLHSGRSALDTRLPSDFPIVRWNPSDPNTYTLGETTTTDSSLHAFTSFLWVPARAGTPVRLTRENQRMFVLSFNTHNETLAPFPLVYLRLNLTAHNTLANTPFTYRGRTMPKGEIIAYPDYPESAYSGGRTFSADTIVAYRYAQHWILPNRMRTRLSLHPITLYAFWLPYALKHAGVVPNPSRPFPVYLECDHFLAINATGSYNYTTMLNLYADYYAWIADFCNARGTHLICGTYGSGTTHQQFAHPVDSEVNQNLDATARAAGERVLQLLRTNHHKATPVGIHDHRVFAGRGWGDNAIGSGTIRRHSASERYPLGKPNDVRRRTGRVVLKDAYRGSPPAGTLEVEIDGQVYYDIPTGASDEMTGTGDLSAPHSPRDYWLAKIVIERGEEYVVNQLGFPDAWCGSHRYTQTAAHSSGGLGYWRVLKEKGVRGIRHQDLPSEGAFQQRVPFSRVWNGLVLINPDGVEIGVPGPHYGLYHPSKDNWVRAASGTRHFDIDNDISTNWNTQYEAMACRAYQRVFTTMFTSWLGIACRLNAPVYHPPHILGMLSATEPLAPFDPARLCYIATVDGHNAPHWNMTKEMLELMDFVVQILPEFYRWGTVSDVMDRIEEEV